MQLGKAYFKTSSLDHTMNEGHIPLGQAMLQADLSFDGWRSLTISFRAVSLLDHSFKLFVQIVNQDKIYELKHNKFYLISVLVN